MVNEIELFTLRHLLVCHYLSVTRYSISYSLGETKILPQYSHDTQNLSVGF